MTLSALKQILPTLDHVVFQLENGTLVPKHFHITEVGMTSKSFIDCGGVIRQEKWITLQLWNAGDENHRLKPTKLLDILNLSTAKLSLEDVDIEVEYQGDTIGKYDLAFNGKIFILKNKATACLAQDACNTPEKREPGTGESTRNSTCCTPNTGCC